MYVRGVRGQVGMAAAVALYKKRKKSYKIRIVRKPGTLYLYGWQLVQSYTLIYLYFPFDKSAMFLQIAVQKVKIRQR